MPQEAELILKLTVYAVSFKSENIDSRQLFQIKLRSRAKRKAEFFSASRIKNTTIQSKARLKM